MAGGLIAEQLNGFYRDIALDMGVEVAVQMYEHFKGLQVVFPTKLLDSKFIQTQILKEYDGRNYKQIALKYGYSERWVRKIIKSRTTKMNQEDVKYV
ncbi:MAG: Mor transcription activator family protein [Candidatus Fimivivens sp.]|nr:Mor transcription activator family protein [Candidatus Fimivivens sp.]